MDESKQDDLAVKIQFPASMPKDEREEILKSIREKRQTSSKLTEYEAKPYQERDLSEKEKAILVEIIKKANIRLSELGIDSSTLSPKPEQIRFVEYRDESEKEAGGYTEVNGAYIQVAVPVGFSINDPEVLKTIYHEISHFITAILIGPTFYNWEKFSRKAVGFVKDTPDMFIKKGILEEPLAEIFALFCLQDIEENPVFSTGYNLQVPFVIALLEKFAERSGITPFEAFKKIFAAKVRRDFSIYKDIVAAFGSETTRGLNNIIADWHLVPDKDPLNRLARQAGFEENYTQLQERLNDGKIIGFPSFAGGIKAAKDAAEGLNA